MALKDLGEKGIVDPYPPLVDIKGDFLNSFLGDVTLWISYLFEIM